MFLSINIRSVGAIYEIWSNNYVGAFSGMVATIVMAPGERVKCLLQVQSSAR
jgi:hypothetical protein